MAQGLNFAKAGNIHFGKHPEDEPLKSSVNEIRNLEETLVWDDIETLVNNRIEMLQLALERADEMPNIRRIQGELQAWRHFLDMPQTLINYREAQNNDPR